MSKKTKWIVISMLILTAILFAYGWYKVDQLARAVNCLYLPDYKMVNETECR